MKKFLQVAAILMALFMLWYMACAGMAYAGPTEERVDLTEYKYVNSIEALSDYDYELIYKQTGLGRAGVQTLIDSFEMWRLPDIQDRFYEEPTIVRERLNIVRHQERIKNYEESNVYFPVEDGDIIVTLSSHIGGWRYGHAGLVVDAKKGYVLEAITFGEPSCLMKLSHWAEFPQCIILRAKDLSKEERAAIAKDAADNLTGIDYDLLASIRESEVSGDNITRTQCAHLIWYAFYRAGIDIDGGWSPYVTPQDIVTDNDLEIVEEYGFVQKSLKMSDN